MILAFILVFVLVIGVVGILDPCPPRGELREDMRNYRWASDRALDGAGRAFDVTGVEINSCRHSTTVFWGTESTSHTRRKGIQHEGRLMERSGS